jgi:glycosyltransferase involved in cell wall biosynthesis
MNRSIALISEHASPLAVLGGVDAGGQNVYVAQVARELAALGDHVDVFTRRDDPDVPTVVDVGRDYRVIHVPAGPAAPVAKEDLLPFMPAFVDWMIRDWTTNHRRYDLVHANFFMSGQVAADIRETLGVPFVITFHALGKVRRLHQGPNDGFPPEREAVEGRIVAEADRVIAECPQDEVDLVRLYGADPRRISLAPCGYDPEEFPWQDQAAARRSLGIDPDEHVVLQLGRLVPRKGVDNVIEAVGRLRRTHGISARLLIVGGSERRADPARDPEIKRLADVARAAGVSDRVTFVGRRDRSELAAYYGAADVFVSTPWYEPFGITPLEAMACGTPVIGSDVGGLRYTIRDGETGFLVPPRDPDVLAHRLARVLCDPTLSARFSAKGMERVRSTFTWRHVAKRLSAIYEDVLREGAAVRPQVPRPALEAPAAAATVTLPVR